MCAYSHNTENETYLLNTKEETRAFPVCGEKGEYEKFDCMLETG
jgi:hypothetical protein